MNDSILKKPEQEEPTFKLNYSTVILLVVVLIPILYTVVTNLQKKELAPSIILSANSEPTKNSALPASEGNEAKPVVDNANYQAYLNLGLAYYKAEKYAESITAFKKALEYNPQSEIVYNNIAATYGAMNKWDEEIEACEKALAINPNFQLAKNNLAWAREMKAKNKF